MTYIPSWLTLQKTEVNKNGKRLVLVSLGTLCIQYVFQNIGTNWDSSVHVRIFSSTYCLRLSLIRDVFLP